MSHGLHEGSKAELYMLYTYVKAALSHLRHEHEQHQSLKHLGTLLSGYACARPHHTPVTCAVGESCWSLVAARRTAYHGLTSSHLMGKACSISCQEGRCNLEHNHLPVP